MSSTVSNLPDPTHSQDIEEFVQTTTYGHEELLDYLIKHGGPKSDLAWKPVQSDDGQPIAYTNADSNDWVASVCRDGYTGAVTLRLFDKKTGQPTADHNRLTMCRTTPSVRIGDKKHTIKGVPHSVSIQILLRSADHEECATAFVSQDRAGTAGHEDDGGSLLGIEYTAGLVDAYEYPDDEVPKGLPTWQQCVVYTVFNEMWEEFGLSAAGSVLPDHKKLPANITDVKVYISPPVAKDMGLTNALESQATVVATLTCGIKDLTASSALEQEEKVTRLTRHLVNLKNTNQSFQDISTQSPRCALVESRMIGAAREYEVSKNASRLTAEADLRVFRDSMANEGVTSDTITRILGTVKKAQDQQAQSYAHTIYVEAVEDYMKSGAPTEQYSEYHEPPQGQSTDI